MKVALLGLLAVACAIPHPPPAPPRQTHLGLQLSSSTLPNGLRVVLLEDANATEVQVTMRYQVGAADDPADQLGIAHLVEHLMFQQVLGSKSLFSTLEDIASSFNAFTTYDTTTYVARAQPAQLDRLLSIEAVRMGFRCTSITDSVFEREREVVINEVKQRSAGRELRQALYETLYPDAHPYRREGIGSPETVGAITRAQACEFADRHYAPRNAVLVVSGNVSPAQVVASLSKFLARIADRPVAPRVPIAPVPAIGRAVEIKAPIDREFVLVAWPIGPDPINRARLRAVAPTVAALIDRQVRGLVVPLEELGDGRAPITAIAIVPADGETAAQAIAAAKDAISSLPVRLGELTLSDLGDATFNQMRQSALYQVFAGLADGRASSRDSRFADYVIGGIAPRVAIAHELEAIGKMTRGGAVSAARELFNVGRATFLTVHPDTASNEKATVVALSPPVHDLGSRRDPPDPADAHRAATAPRAQPIPGAIRSRVLPNGMRVVLVPTSSVPTVDLRLVFQAGSGDEPDTARGSALVAARGLTWNRRHENDLLRFAAVGGTNTVEVGFDLTSFTARGLDMHIDVLLAGLRRWVRDGTYDDTADVIAEALLRQTKGDDNTSVTDAWREARYGNHPYRHAGLAHHASNSVDVHDAERFRAAHYVPERATLIVAGGFDAALADRWIDYLFADWTGHNTQRSIERATPAASSLAFADRRPQVELEIALPASGPRRHQQLLAEMLDIVAADVRHQLGATYDLRGRLDEARLATTYTIGGFIEPDRLHEAIELLARRIHELASGGELAERTFVAARARLATRLAALGSSGDIADTIERDIAMLREPLSDASHADDVLRVTIDDLPLAQLDLAKAAMLMRGPRDRITDAYAVLGRTPRFIKTMTYAPIPPRPLPERRRYSFAGFDDALTEQTPAEHFGLTATAGVSLGNVFEHAGKGGQFALAGLYWPGSTAGFGAELTYGTLGATFTEERDSLPVVHPFSANVLRLTAVAAAAGYERLWGAVLIGIHKEWISGDAEMTTTSTGLAIGAEVGVDLYQIHTRRLGAYLRGDASPFSGSGYSTLAFGIALRM